MDDHQRQALVTAFNNALRACNLVGTVDLQRTSLAFAAMLQNLPRPGVVPLGPSNKMSQPSGPSSTPITAPAKGLSLKRPSSQPHTPKIASENTTEIQSMGQRPQP